MVKGRTTGPRTTCVTPPQGKVGARLAVFLPAWEEMTNNQFILRILRKGLTLEFLEDPPLSGDFVPFSLPRAEGRRAALLAEIELMLEKGAIVPVQKNRSKGFYSNLFLVAKATGGFRPVINLKALNQKIQNPSFKMETIRSVIKAVTPGDWSVSIDLKDAYFHVPIHKEFQKFLRFATSQTQAYQFRALPFGLSTAPRIFSMLTREVAQHLHMEGIKIHFYLDDWLIRSQDPRVLAEQSEYVLDLTRRLGFLINDKKSELTPSRQFSYLGVEFDTQEGLVRPSMERVKKLEGWVNLFCRRPHQPARAILSLLGHLSSLGDVVHLGRLRARPLQLFLLSVWSPLGDSLESLIRIPDQCLENLKWWQDRRNTLRGVPLEEKEPDVMLLTDASLEGWGAHLTKGSVKRQLDGRWHSDYSNRSINSLELETILLAMRGFRDLLENAAVLILSDNATAVSYIRRQGGTHSTLLCGLAWQIYMLAEELNLSVSINHIPGKRNVLADALSRAQPIQTEWQLSRTVFQAVLSQLNLSPLVDLMATPENTQLPVFICPYPEPEALGVDAMSMGWDQFRVAYVFPPTAMVREVLNKVRKSSSIVICIAPWWPNQAWFPDLLELSLDLPIALPQGPHLLSQQVKRRTVYHKRSEVMHLHAWTLSGNCSLERVTQRMLCSGSATQQDLPQIRSMMDAGRSGQTGAGRTSWIRSTPLNRV